MAEQTRTSGEGDELESALTLLVRAQRFLTPLRLGQQGNREHAEGCCRADIDRFLTARECHFNPSEVG